MLIRFFPATLVCSALFVATLPAISAAMPSLDQADLASAPAPVAAAQNSGYSKEAITELAKTFYSAAQKSHLNVSPEQREQQDNAINAAIDAVVDMGIWFTQDDFTRHHISHPKSPQELKESWEEPKDAHEDIFTRLSWKIEKYKGANLMPDEIGIFMGDLDDLKKDYTSLQTRAEAQAKRFSPEKLIDLPVYLGCEEVYFPSIMSNFPGTERVNYLLACIDVIDALKKHLGDFLDPK